MRMAVTWLAVVSACTFSPTVDGDAINDCDTDVDCPQCGSCVKGVCVPLEPPLDELVVQAVEPTVPAGEPCRIEVTGPTCNTRYDFTQVGGPRVGLTADVYHVDVATNPAYIGDYTVRVRAETDGGRVTSGQASCTAIIEQYGAFVVLGTGGDCSRDNPCGSVETALATDPLYVYLGVQQLDRETYFEVEPPNDHDLVSITHYDHGDHQVHGGFVFPGWTRDLDRALTTIHPTTDNLDIGIVVSGIYHRFVPRDATLPHAVRLLGDGATLRDSRILIDGVSPELNAVGVHGAVGAETHVEGCRIEVNAGAELQDITTINVLDNMWVSDSILDLSAATAARRSTGAAVYFESELHIENTLVRPGVGSWISVGLASVEGVLTAENVIVDGRFTDTEALFDEALGAYVDARATGHFRSCLLQGGRGPESAGLVIEAPGLGDSTVTNTILDAGTGQTHFSLVIAPGAVPAGAVQNVVLVVPPDPRSQSGPGGWDDTWDALDLPGLEAALNCTGCVTEVASAFHVDQEAGDFHLTEESACCLDNGASGAPSHDFDGVVRDDPPDIGPFELRP